MKGKVVFSLVILTSCGIIFGVQYQKEEERRSMRKSIMRELEEERKIRHFIKEQGLPICTKMVKGPKVMNPADKARKEARKKELKKNKKQRQQVRSAAIEGKNPELIIADLEKLDRLEFETATDPTLSDSFYKDKRKRLKETLNKILSYYQKEDPSKFDKVKSLESKYEINYQKQLREFQAIRAAQEVKIEDIFLPPETNTDLIEIADDDPLLSETVYITPFTEGLKPPGCPPGMPPDLSLIVNSLKSSLANPVETMPLPLSAHPMHLQLAQGISKGKPLHLNYKTRAKPIGNYENKQMAPDKPTAPTKPTIQPGIFKPTVIESKPVLFKPKVTKFVPASVRSKINRS